MTSREKLLAGIAIILFLSNAVTIFFFIKTSGEKDSTILAKDNELNEAYINLDSIGIALEEKIRVIDSLGGNIDTLMAIKEQLEADKRYIRSTSNKKIAELEDRVEGYRELLVNQDKEIERLKKMNEALYTENTELKTEKNQLFESINKLTKKEKELTSKLEIAGKLEAENITVYAVNNRGRERANEFRSRQIDQLKITLEIAENEVAPIGSKIIYLVVLDENNQQIFDTNMGSGTFITEDKKELFYTTRQEILYDRTRQELSFTYQHSNKYLPGNYVAAIYADGYKIGETLFSVK